MRTSYELRVCGGRVLRTSPVFDTYWRFACERQEMFMRRVHGATPPWTEDPILGAHRFTNTYRASDRVSQYLIRRVIYEGSQKPEEVVFRTILFKLFNRMTRGRRFAQILGRLAGESITSACTRTFWTGSSTPANASTRQLTSCRRPHLGARESIGTIFGSSNT